MTLQQLHYVLPATRLDQQPLKGGVLGDTSCAQIAEACPQTLQADSVATVKTVITHCEKKQYKKTSKCIALEVCVQSTPTVLQPCFHPRHQLWRWKIAAERLRQ
jgi:hypothetical protein